MLLSLASAKAARMGQIIAESERPGRVPRAREPLVFRLRGAPALRLRARGERSVPEIPLAEIRAVIALAETGRARAQPAAALRNRMLALYEVAQPRAADLAHIDRAIEMRGEL